jgi:hypothetical protein
VRTRHGIGREAQKSELSASEARRIIELPPGRPFAPQYPAQFAAVLHQAFATALRLEEMLIPEDALKRRFDRVSFSRNVDHVVAGVRYESTNPLGP